MDQRRIKVAYRVERGSVIGAPKKRFGVEQLLANGRYRGRRVIQEAVSDTHSDEIQRVWSATAEVELRPLPLATLSISPSASTAGLLSKWSECDHAGQGREEGEGGTAGRDCDEDSSASTWLT